MTSSKFHSVQRFVAVGSTLLAGFALFTGCTSSGDDTSDDSSAAATAGRSGTTPAGAGGALYPDLGAAGEGGEAGQPSGGSGGTSGALGGLGGGSGTVAGGNGGASTGGSGSGSGGVAGGGTAGMSAGGSGGAASTTCGNGIVDAGEACDASSSMGGTGGGTADPTCSNTCTKVSNAACVACEFEGGATCTDFLFNCQGPGGSFTAAQQTQCNSVLTCIQSSNCFDGTGSLGGACYCGTLSLADCQAAPFDLSKPGAPNGACATVIQAGLPGLSANAAVLGSLNAAAKPAGAAMQLLNCQKTAESAACLGACGFTTGGPAFP